MPTERGTSARGSPEQVADTLADYQEPEARAANGNNEYLRYSNNIVIVGPDGNYPCSIRVESLGAGYSHGAFIFLGPGFTPGSPSGGAGGTPRRPGRNQVTPIGIPTKRRQPCTSPSRSETSTSTRS